MTLLWCLALSQVRTWLFLRASGTVFSSLPGNLACHSSWLYRPPPWLSSSSLGPHALLHGSYLLLLPPLLSFPVQPGVTCMDENFITSVQSSPLSFMVFLISSPTLSSTLCSVQSVSALVPDHMINFYAWNLP